MLIESKYIKALSLFVANNKETRYYLQYINFELHADKTIMTACDGHVLLSIMIEKENDTVDNFSIPVSVFNNSKMYIITRKEDGRVYVGDGQCETQAPIVDTKYVDFRRAIPGKKIDGGEPAYFDPELSMKFKKASKLLGGIQWPIIYSNGLVDIGLHNVVGVQSPLRNHVALKNCAHDSQVKPLWMEMTIATPELKLTKAA